MPGSKFPQSIVVEGTVASNDGSVSLPAYTFTSDLDTGIYSVAADQLGITIGGNLVMTYSDVSPNVRLDVLAAGDIGFIIGAASSQTANLTEWQADAPAVYRRLPSKMRVIDPGLLIDCRISDE